MLTENKFSKYLVYAFGEIVLVVIGILFALSINNWNEERKEKIVAKDLLNVIRLDLQVDTLRFFQYLEHIPTTIESTELLLNNTELDSLSANSLIGKLPFTAFSYKIRKQSYEKVITSGMTNFFEFNDLFNDINTYYTSDLSSYNDVKDWDYEATRKDGDFWFNLGFEINFSQDEKIRTAQTETTRRTLFLEQMNSSNMRNSLKLNILRKKLLIEMVKRTNQRAKEIILKIERQLNK